MTIEINWEYEFETFMAELGDYEGLPIWDRYLANMHCCAVRSFWFQKRDIPERKDRFISSAFVYLDSPEGLQFWRVINQEWQKRMIEIMAARMGLRK